MSNTTPVSMLDFEKMGLHSPIKIEAENTEKNDFLQLFVAQLKNQNPLDPQDGAEFLSQLAQFSTVEGIRNLDKTFHEISESLNSTQALQASSLVGKKVQVNTELGVLMPGNTVKGTMELPRPAENVILEIQDMNGNPIKSYSYNMQRVGDVAFEWDGLDKDGNAAPEGVYRFVAKAALDGQFEEIKTYIASNVDSVTISKNGDPVMLNVSGYGKISIDDIKAINS